ncbi:MAG: DNA polymerase III subunit beta [Candidatus Buchananbacteria bacterium RBG_13_36_9]|uniref:Beta sliding clamp n=1 Tax=Candidatus Buchananbacteria bacterium RBG_13_36_9 TaxID=1797530 RepID=A0A1G1XQ27_9BACT|nr:MAG: DNA polymerase III subunit beta [Candidatus Buchananbacteria bacterium RBG_13_36_9]
MKITCTQENLNKGLSIVSHIASKSTSLPILNNVLIKAEKGVINLITTNLEMGISCLVRGKIEKDGVYTVGSKLLNDYIGLLPNEKIELGLKDDFLEIKATKQETKIKGNSAEEFPLIPQVEKKNPYICRVEDLIGAFSQVLFAVSVSETRPEISGIYLNFSNGILTLTATDSYRLAEKKIKVKEKAKEEKEVIVPARTISEALRILSTLISNREVTAEKEQNLENVEIYFEDNQVLFVFDNVELVSRIIEGQYPNYRQIIPANYKTKGLINITELIKAAKTTSLFSRTGIFDINIEFKKGEMLVTSTNSQLGESKTKIEGQIEGDSNRIVINYRYLLDGLQNLDSTDVIFEMTDSNNPCVLRSAESLPEGQKPIAGEDYLYIIMPIKQ